jgi:hypothetical protein
MSGLTISHLRAYIPIASKQFDLREVLVKLDGHILTNARLIDGVLALSSADSMHLPISSGLLVSYLDDLVKADPLNNHRAVQVNGKELMNIRVEDEQFFLDGAHRMTEFVTGVGDHIRTTPSREDADTAPHVIYDSATLVEALAYAESMMRNFGPKSSQKQYYGEMLGGLRGDILKQNRITIQPLPPRGEPTEPFRLV